MTSLTEAQIVDQWRRIDQVASLLAQRLGSQDGFAVAPGSQLARDDADTYPYHVSTAIALAISAAVDHLHGLCILALHSGWLHLSATASLARGALECASAAVWISCVDDGDERLTRALRWHIADIKDGDRAAKTANVPIPTSLETRKAKVAGVAARRALKFSTIGAGYQSSEAVKAADAYLQLQQLSTGVHTPWQMASGFAHGRSWSRLADESILTKTPTEDPDVSNVKMEPNLGRLLYLALPAEQATSGAVRLFDRLAKVR